MSKSIGIDVYPQRHTTTSVNVAPSSASFDVDIYTKGSSDKFFRFNQGVPSNEWVIIHNLDKYPSVTVVDSAENYVIGEVQYINTNKLIVRFTTPFSGKAYLN